MDMIPTKQELFDAVAYMSPELQALYYDADRLVIDNIEDIKTVGFTDKYYDGLAAIAEKYGVKFVHPKYASGLKSVDSHPTVH